MPSNCEISIGNVIFWFRPLNMWPRSFCKNSRNHIGNHIFPGKGREDWALISKYLDNSMAKIFSSKYLNFSISAIFRGKRGTKLPHGKISTKSGHIWGSKIPKPPQKFLKWQPQTLFNPLLTVDFSVVIYK